MDFLKKEQDVQEAMERAKQLKNELINSLRNQFVALPYELKEIEVDFEGVMFEGKKIKVYYPILNNPKGYKKENERFYRKYANGIKHEYTLIDEEGRKVTILEYATFENKLYKDKLENTHMYLNFYIADNFIEYYISMFVENYTFKREFNPKQLLNEIIGKENIVRYEDHLGRKEYSQIEEEYQKFLKVLGIKHEIPTLKVLANTTNEKKIQITESISAIISTEIEEDHYHCIWLNNPKYSVRLDDVKYYKTTIKVKPYLNNTIKMEEREFCYAELENEAELRKGKTLDEIIELLE